MNSIYHWLSLIIVLINNQQQIEGKIFSVADYGAYPNDDLDDTHAIQLAINDAIHSGLSAEIDFGLGVYVISSTIDIENAMDLTVKGQGIDRTFLIANDSIAVFVVLASQRVTLTSFSIDYNPLPFTAGYVVNGNNDHIDVQVVPPHQTDVGRKVQAILRYDPVNMRPAFGPHTYEIYQTPPDNITTSIVSAGVLRLPLASPVKFGIGDPVVVRYAFVWHTIYGGDVTDMTLKSVHIYTSWGMGFVTLRARRLNIVDYHVKRYQDRWMSTIVDCTHHVDARESISISDSSCEGMGDDGLNVHGVFFLVTQVIDSSTIIIQAMGGTDALDLGVGTNLEFSSHDQPFTVHASGTVALVVFHSPNSRKLVFTNSIDVKVDDWVCVSDTPLLTIRNFTVSHNRARGVLLETRNIDIRQSVFNRTSGPAVLIQPSMYWHEGPEARNVSLIDNLYIENNEGIAQEKGIITILPDPPELIPVHSDIRIESSTFYFGADSLGLVQSDNTNNLFISDNYIALNSSLPLISICNSRNISAQHNCVVNSGAKIDTYYTFDTTTPCAMNLSSLIDLPASAFNASFPPPVLIDSSFHSKTKKNSK